TSDVCKIDINIIDRKNTLSDAYTILSHAMDKERLREVAAIVSRKKVRLDPQEAKDYALRAVQFKNDKGRLPSATAYDPWERMLAGGAAAFVRFKDQGAYD